MSEEISILCAAVPVSPVTPTTTVIANQVEFDWQEPVANGRPIIGYKIYIRKSDLTYYEDLTECLGFDATVMAETKCLVPLSALTAEPYNLLLGYSIYIKISAVNDYGDSIPSNAGNGAVIVLVPDAPISLVNNLDVTT
jgi:hypothetical protein